MSPATEARRLNVALIGCGKHMQEALFPTLRLNPNVNIVAVSSRTHLTAQAFAKKWNIESVPKQWRDLFELNIDAIVCSGPLHLHEEVAQECIRRNVPLFVEKPLCENFSKLIELKKLLAARTLPLQVGYNLRFSASCLAFAEAVAATEADHIEIEYHTNKPKEPLWGLESLTQSFLLAIAVHPLSLVEKIGGEVEKVLNVSQNQKGTEINLELSVAHQNQKTSRVIISNTKPKFEFRAKALRNGETVVELENMFTVNGAKGATYRASVLQPTNLASGYFQQMECFVNAVKGEKVSNDDISDSIWFYKIFDEILKKGK